MPAIVRWSRSSVCSGRGASSSVCSSSGCRGRATPPGRAWPAPRPASRPRRGSSLTHAACLEPNSRRRSSRPSVERAPAAARCDRAARRACRTAAAARPTSGGSAAPAGRCAPCRSRAEVDDQVLAAPAARPRSAPDERAQRRVKGLQRVDARRERRLDAARRAAHASSRRAVISTSGSSGIALLRLVGGGPRCPL